jgi:hypothetical protein
MTCWATRYGPGPPQRGIVPSFKSYRIEIKIKIKTKEIKITCSRQ